MRGKQANPKTGDTQKVMNLVTRLNQYRHEYYNLAAPSVSDAVYDRLYDELQKLEKKTGIIYSNSPTQTVGYVPISALEKVKHSVPLLSLDKTKQTDELQQMLRKAAALLMLKLDGLTIKLCYEDGELTEASTRGDGDVGELITHNIPEFCNVPVKIPHKGRLVISGEGLIKNHDFKKLKDKAFGIDGKEACNARNLAAGSIRVLNPSICKERCVHFYAFNVVEGMEAFGRISDSRGKILQAVRELGFDICPFVFMGKMQRWRKLRRKYRNSRRLRKTCRFRLTGWCCVMTAFLIQRDVAGLDTIIKTA